jgi:hypothetical protein
VTLKRGGAVLVVRDAPAEICQNCSEAYLSEDVLRELLKQGEITSQAGVLVNISEFSTASI